MSDLMCINPECGFISHTTGRIYTCEKCDSLLDFRPELKRIDPATIKDTWHSRLASPAPIDRSGVWRYRELLPEASESEVVTIGEGNTQLFDAPKSASYAGVSSLTFKHLGLNPTGSFKDLGMTTGVTQARKLGASTVACASTGNTSASMAAYAARCGMRAVIFIPTGQIALGKLSQALDYGAVVVQMEGDFDAAMTLVRELTVDSPMYLLNSVNPFRLEGQKTIGIELFQQLGWRLPDRIVVPGGNLGNSSAIAKGLDELKQLGLIERIPKITIIQAEGANPLYKLWKSGSKVLEPVKGASTLATAIKIGNPVSWRKAVRGLEWSGGSVEQVSEEEIADAKAMIGRDGIGCEPASAVTLAGIRKLRASGTLDKEEEIVAILTGHVLKDPDYIVNYHNGTLTYTGKDGEVRTIHPGFANRIVRLGADRQALIDSLGL